MRLNSPGPRSQAIAGFTLVEVLVALAVLCVGLLGFASLSLDGLRGSRRALQYTRGTDLAADMAERIRANRGAAAAYALAEGAVAAAPAVDCDAPGECAAADVAALDLHDWQQEVQAALPEAVTSIVVTVAGSATTCVVTLRWTTTDGPAPAVVELVART